MADGLVRSLKAKAIWVDPEDKTRFEYIVLHRKAETGKMQTQESAFKYLLDEFFKQHKGVVKA
jgi:capsule polysaccharide export protein KpsC/LpsZ